MSSLDAVEEVPVLRVHAVHGRVLHLVLLAGLGNIDGQVGYHDEAGSPGQDHETILLGEDCHLGSGSPPLGIRPRCTRLCFAAPEGELRG